MQSMWGSGGGCQGRGGSQESRGARRGGCGVSGGVGVKGDPQGWGGDPAGSVSPPGALPRKPPSSWGCWSWCLKGKAGPCPSQGGDPGHPLSPQVAGVSPGRHLVPAEASRRAEDRLLRPLLGPEHQPQVPEGAADCGGYWGERLSQAHKDRWDTVVPPRLAASHCSQAPATQPSSCCQALPPMAKVFGCPPVLPA